MKETYWLMLMYFYAAIDNGIFTLRDCKLCGERKPLFQFNRHKREKLGRRYDCRECQRKINAEFRESHPTYKKDYRKINRPKLLEYNKTYYYENREAILAQEREKYYQNKSL